MQQKKTTKHNKLLEKRYKRNAMLKWQELISNERNKEAKAKLVLDRMRRNLVKPAFDSYKAQYKKYKYLEFKDTRLQVVVDKYNAHIMRKIYIAWQAYNFVNKENARLLKKFLMFMTHSNLRRNLQRWKFRAKLKKESLVIKEYNDLGKALQVDHSTYAKTVDSVDKQKLEYQ